MFYNQSSGVCLANVGIYDCKLDCTLKGYETSFVHKKKHIAITAAAAAAKPLQSCPTLCDPIDSSPPGPAVPGVL